MARPERNNVDYFPFYCEDGNKMFYLEETYGNDGFATFVKILRELAKTNFHYLDLSKRSTLMFLSAKCKVSQEILKSIINDLVDLGKFDAVLWNENKVIWCQDFVDSIQDAYKKRNNKCMTYQGLLVHLQSLGVRKQGKGSIKGGNKPQRKEKEIKEENNTPPKGGDNFNFYSTLLKSGAKKQFASEWIKVRKNKKLTQSETALKRFLIEVEKSGFEINEVLEKCIEQSWGGFKAEWYQKQSSKTNQPINEYDENGRLKRNIGKTNQPILEYEDAYSEKRK